MKTMRSDIKTNLASVVRHDQLEGRDYFVVPAAQLAEGVWAGSEGPVLYENEDIEKFASAWDHKPIVVYHPQLNGKGVTACDPVIIENQKVGIILNSKLQDGKNRIEAWLEKDKLQKVDKRVYEAIQNNQIVEVSTGLFFDLEDKPGEYDGKKYIGIARNYRPDHLAILPDKKGAYSVDAGAGLLQLNEHTDRLSDLSEDQKKKLQEVVGNAKKAIQNEMSHSKCYSYLVRAIQSKMESNGKPWYGYIEDVYDTYVIYSADGGMFMVDYTSTDDGVKLGKSRKVERVVQYQTVGGTPVGNATLPTTNSEEVEMARKQQVDALIAQNSFAEKDREWLTKLDDGAFTTLFGGIENTKKIAANAAKEEAEKKAKEEKGPATNEEKKDTPKPKAKNFQEFVNNDLPEEFREPVQELMAGHQETKTRLINNIMNSEAGKAAFKSADDLKGMKINELRRYEKMALAGQSEEQRRQVVHNYAGQEGGLVDNVASAPKVLGLPSLDEPKK